MVKIAIVGGSGNVGQEIIDALVARNKHEIILLSRKDAPPEYAAPGVTWVKTSYEDPEQLVKILRGVDTVLSFVTVATDPGNLTQRNLIDAAVRAGVRRFAPSEWAASDSEESMPWYQGKLEIRKYLRELNKQGKILEYSLFQPGLFMNYFTYPYPSTKHVQMMPTPIDYHNCRALMVEGSDDARVSLITAQDLATFVVRAVEYEGEWPRVGGIRASELMIRQIVQVGERVRGRPFTVESLKVDDLKAGVVKSSWLPKPTHPSLTPEEADTQAEAMTAGILLGLAAEALKVSDEWNKLLPDFVFTKAEDFLTEAWRGKP
ncbi:NAD(P)-binding protein [Parathielavia appendiculata]|uniref:NAD(P)-binding protein n=1 Tax=Parathielavia appendiculata TaxID=2587402 RepID=A0AAN6Z1Q6_9PEZI|nr:NAD(P)-binding protein [Parathielavia appendiculata]